MAFELMAMHPARLECGTALAVTEFRPSYRRAAVMQAALATVGSVAALMAWVQGRGTPVLIGGLLLGIAIPFALVVILPTNKRLLDPTLDRNSTEATALLSHWGVSTPSAACSVAPRLFY